jgi:CO/xanthine dehydrogenase FAD-binding subunit
MIWSCKVIRYDSPSSLREALEIIGTDDRRILAGGTDFYPALRDRPVTFDTLDISRVRGLRGVERTDEGWRIGATTTWTDIVRAQLPPCFEGLKAAAREVGSIQIQNAGTVVGNLCNASPAADGVPPLLTLDSQVEIASVSGSRVLPLEAFITDVRETALRPGEMVVAVLVPHQPDSARSAFRKLGSRSYLVISIAMVSALLAPGADGTVGRARIAVGSCSPVASSLPALEAALIGAPFEAEALVARVRPEHLAPLSPIDDVRAAASYRLEAVEELMRRVLADCCDEGIT